MVNNNAIFILGQDQDSYGGDSAQYQGFFGQMYGVYMWDTVLPGDEVLCLPANCTHQGSWPLSQMDSD